MQSETQDDHNQTGAPSTFANSLNDNLKQLVSQLVDQLLNGCKNAECTQALCHTGRLNINNKPVRRYTQRSAQVIALTVCSGPNPTRFICSDYHAQPSEASSTTLGGDYDTSSLPQLLCNTPSVREFYTADDSLVTELHPLHQKLDLAQEYASGRVTTPSGDLLSNEQLVEHVMPCVEWLLTRLPAQRMAIWEMIDHEVISKGRAFPQKSESRPTDERYNTWLTILDVLDHEVYLRLLRRILHIFCLRMKLETELSRIRSRLGSTHQNNPNVKMTIANEFAMAYMNLPGVDGARSYALVIWLKKLFAREWDSSPVLASGSLCPAILEIYAAFNLTTYVSATIPKDAFLMPLIRCRLTEVALARTYLDGRADFTVHLLDYRFLFPVDQLFLCFRTVNHLTMREAHSKALKAVALRQKGAVSINSIPSQVQHSEEHYLLLSVPRTSALQDSFDQLWQRRKTELRRPLRVRLGQTDGMELGHDLGGVQIEYFGLVCREILCEDLQMFTTDPKTGLSYFKPCSLQPLHMFELFGVLFALAIYNGITLPIRFPWIFYHILLKPPGPVTSVAEVGIRHLLDGWPVTVSSMEKILSEDDVYGLDFEFPLEANGLRLSVLPPEYPMLSAEFKMQVVDATPIVHHGGEANFSEQTSSNQSNGLSKAHIPDAWPGWIISSASQEPIEVTAENKRHYVQTYARWLCFSSVAPQFEAFRRGFHESNLFPNGALTILGPSHLKSYIEGTDTFEVADLKAATRYDGYDPKSKYIQAFWKIVAAWPEAKQKQLLKFVTAAERIPITGVAKLVFIVKRANVENLNNLPTSSTCFGTLMLPKYKNAEILKEKLGLALKFGAEGFGTG